MKKIILAISLILVFGLLLNISGCIPSEEAQEESNEVSELEQMEEDLNPDNLGGNLFSNFTRIERRGI